ncbi:MAG: ATP-dependent Clp protease adaptor ClpS [Muribaculaceae bacterium]|nr:ATP-dependent Clp protease adaptor ClpS [Muribaculaceae bacterium]MDE6633208.1 ATP-dependent Clp protease adaptor ClpS [Muribaculaceae bacterium]
MAQEQISIRQQGSVNIGRPRKYSVIFHNDDFTTMDFVVKVLKDVFYKSEVEAVSIMMDVHKKGVGVVGSYPYDLALTKKDRAIEMAREEGFPLRITVQPI